MIQIVGTILAALFGLAFGSFANVCLSRWPEGESVVRPGSHCRSCGHALAAWENIPILSWIVLRGRCRQCDAAIGVRYILVEAVMSALWAGAAWESLSLPSADIAHTPTSVFWLNIGSTVFILLVIWLLVVLAVLDAEHFWLPDRLTWTGIVAGLAFHLGQIALLLRLSNATEVPLAQGADVKWFDLKIPALELVGGVLAAAALMLLIRWVYWLFRRREGMGLGDVKLMAMLAALLGIENALLAFVLGAVLGAMWALVLLAAPKARDESAGWAGSKLPLGTFLCTGGIVSALWGSEIIAAYLRWAGL